MRECPRLASVFYILAAMLTGGVAAIVFLVGNGEPFTSVGWVSIGFCSYFLVLVVLDGRVAKGWFDSAVALGGGVITMREVMYGPSIYLIALVLLIFGWLIGRRSVWGEG